MKSKYFNISHQDFNRPINVTASLGIGLGVRTQEIIDEYNKEVRELSKKYLKKHKNLSSIKSMALRFKKLYPELHIANVSDYSNPESKKKYINWAKSKGFLEKDAAIDMQSFQLAYTAHTINQMIYITNKFITESYKDPEEKSVRNRELVNLTMAGQLRSWDNFSKYIENKAFIARYQSDPTYRSYDIPSKLSSTIIKGGKLVTKTIDTSSIIFSRKKLYAKDIAELTGYKYVRSILFVHNLYKSFRAKGWNKLASRLKNLTYAEIAEVYDVVEESLKDTGIEISFVFDYHEEITDRDEVKDAFTNAIDVVRAKRKK